MKAQLEELFNKLSTETDRFVLLDHEHFQDKHSGYKYHLYDSKPFEVTIAEGGAHVAAMRDFNTEEQAIFQKMSDYLNKTVTGAARAKMQAGLV